MDRTAAGRGLLAMLAVACCLWVTLPATARGVVLTGTVVEPSKVPNVPGFMPLERVTVTLEGSGQTDTTGPNGMFQFPSVPQGDVVLRMERKGYVTARRTVSLRGGLAPSDLVVLMQPESAGPLPAFSRNSVYVAFADEEWFKSPNRTPNTTAPTASLHYLASLLWGGGELPPGSPPPPDVTPISAARNPILVFDPQSPQRISYLEASVPPFWLAFDSSGRNLFVASAQNTIHVIDTTRGAPLRTVRCPSPVVDLVRGKDLVYAALMGTSQVQVLDGQGKPQGLLAVPTSGRLQSLAADATGQRIFAGWEAGRGGGIAAFDTATSRWVAQEATGTCPLGMATTPDGRFLLAPEGRTSVAVRDAATLKTVAVIPVGITPVRIAVAPDGTRAWVSCRTSNSVHVLDLQTLKQAGTIEVENEPMGLAVTADGARLYVACRGTSTVCAVDTKTGTVIGRTTPQPHSRPTGLAIRP